MRDAWAFSPPSISLMSWAKAKSPISTGRKPKPCLIASIPKSKREIAVMSSSPMVAMSRPISPAIPPLSMDSLARLAIMVSAKAMRAKNSQGPNLRPKRAMGGANRTRSTAPMRPPKNEDQIPTPRARPGFPCRAIGNPSKVVATEEGVPGMPSSVPEMRPPE